MSGHAPYDQPPSPPTCKRCGDRIVWMTMQSGKSMALEPEQFAGDGTRHLVEACVDARQNVIGVMRHAAGPEVLGREAHAAHCIVTARARRIKQAGVKPWGEDRMTARPKAAGDGTARPWGEDAPA